MNEGVGCSSCDFGGNNWALIYINSDRLTSVVTGHATNEVATYDVLKVSSETKWVAACRVLGMFSA